MYADILLQLKCSGEKDGCRRCLTRHIQCRYADVIKVQNHPKRQKRSTASARLEKESQSNSSDSSVNDHSPILPGSAANVAPSPPYSSPDNLGSMSIDYRSLDPATNDNALCLGTSASQEFDDGNLQLGETGRDLFYPDWNTLINPRFLSTPDTLPLDGDNNSVSSKNHLLGYPQPYATHAYPIEAPHFATVEDSQPSPQTPSTCTLSCVDVTITHLATFALFPAIDLSSIPGILQEIKAALKSIATLLSCTTCTSSLSHLGLLIIITQHLVSSYEVILNILTTRFIELHPNPEDRARLIRQAIERGQTFTPNLPILDNKKAKPSMRGYEVDASEEPCVFGGLITLQLRAMLSFIVSLKEVVRKYKSREGTAENIEGEGLELLIQGIERRLLAQLWIVGTCGRLE
jgi:hypothetical protein